MPNFGLINKNTMILENIIVCESLEDAQMFFPANDVVEIPAEIGGPSIGWVYDGTNFAPLQEEAVSE